MNPNPKQVVVWPASVKEVLSYHSTAYMLMTDSGWIARAAWWLLKKRRALTPFVETTRTWTFYPHHQQPLHDAMLKACDSDLPFIRDGKAVFIIGGRTFQELTNAPAFKNTVTFECCPFKSEDPYYGRRAFNIPVHVVPNMVGMALVPRVLIEMKNEATA